MDVASDWMGWVSPGGVRYRALFGTNKMMMRLLRLFTGIDFAKIIERKFC